jgi:hypothetical protein
MKKTPIGKLWYGSWKDHKRIREIYDIDVMVSICRYPPYRYYGSIKKTGVVDFRHLGPSPDLHRWARERMSAKDDRWWTEYAGKYRTQIGNRLIDGSTDKQYNRIIKWLYDGLNVCILCTCAMGKPCHRYLLWKNITDVHKVPHRGSSIVLDFDEDMLENGKVTDLTWEAYAINVFTEKGRVGKENAVGLACPHREMSAAYSRLIKKGFFGNDRAFLYLKSDLDTIKGDWENE